MSRDFPQDPEDIDPDAMAEIMDRVVATFQEFGFSVDRLSVMFQVNLADGEHALRGHMVHPLRPVGESTDFHDSLVLITEALAQFASNPPRPQGEEE